MSNNNVMMMVEHRFMLVTVCKINNNINESYLCLLCLKIVNHYKYIIIINTNK